jgi:hypothetical protein
MDLYSTNNNTIRVSIGSAGRSIDYGYLIGSVIIGCSFMTCEIAIINPSNLERIYTHQLKPMNCVEFSTKIFTIDCDANVLYFQQISKNQTYFDTFDCATGAKMTPTQIYKTDIPILYLWNRVLSSIHIRGNKVYIYSTEQNCLYRTYILDIIPQYVSNYLFIDNILYFLATDMSTQMSFMYSLSVNEIKRTIYFSMDVNNCDYKYTTISYIGKKLIFCCPNMTRTDLTYIQLPFNTFIFMKIPNSSIVNNQYIPPMTSLLQVPEIKYKLNIISNEQFSSLASIIGKNDKSLLSVSSGIDLLNPEILNRFVESICIIKSIDKGNISAPPIHTKSTTKDNTGAIFVKSDIYIDYLKWIIDNYDTSQYTTVYFYNQFIFNWPFYINNDRFVSLQVNLHTVSTTYDTFFMSMGKVNMKDMTIMSRRLCLPMGRISPFCQNNNIDYMVPVRDNFNHALRNKIIYLFIALHIPYVNDFSWSPNMYYKISLSVIRNKPLEFWKKVVQLLNTPDNMDLYSALPYFWTHLFI